MSFLSESNKDAGSISPDNVATGPLVGFFESFGLSMEAQMRTSSMFGIEYAMQALDWEQTKAMLDAGVDNPPQLMLTLEGSEDEGERLYRDEGYYENFHPKRSGEYMEVARHYAGEGASPEIQERMREYDARVAKIKEDRPDLALKTSEQFFTDVRSRAQEVERLQQTNRRTFGGVIGDFAGGAIASMNPDTDPLNFYTLGVGGAGKTAVTRIAAQVGAQGVIETINQATGVQEQRRLQGLSTGFADAAARVVGTAAGAGALQGAGELVAAGARRFFRSTPQDPAPSADVLDPPPVPPKLPRRKMSRAALVEEAKVARIEADTRSHLDIIADETPLSGIAVGRDRGVQDVADVTRQLADWSGGDPVTLKPRVLPDADTSRSGVDVSAAVENNAAYQAAKRADPQTFTKYERLVERKSTYQRWLDELAEGRSADIDNTLAEIDGRLDTLQGELADAKGKNAKSKVRAEIRSAEADKRALLKESRNAETADIAEVRRSLVKVDEQMRDVAPLVGRAYARSRGQWGETSSEADAVWSAYRDGRVQTDPAPDTLPSYDEVMSLTDRAPVLQRADTVEPGETSADTAVRVLEEEAKISDEAVESYRAGVKGLDVSENGTLQLEGSDHVFDVDKDRIFMPDESGTGGREVSVREYLESVKLADEEVEAVSTCSIR